MKYRLQRLRYVYPPLDLSASICHSDNVSNGDCDVHCLRDSCAYMALVTSPSSILGTHVCADHWSSMQVSLAPFGSWPWEVAYTDVKGSHCMITAQMFYMSLPSALLGTLSARGSIWTSSWSSLLAENLF